MQEIKIAYIGGGSRGWAWTLMGDLSLAEDLSGVVSLYDIDYASAKQNEMIGNRLAGGFTYEAKETLKEALSGADFVIISILPGTFREMASDVHTPEAYGIYQSVGDTTGPGGIIRSLRTVPMMEEIARAIRDVCPSAWVINYTNPMAVCVGALYRTFPKIKAFGCCHEVFGTQKFLADIMKKETGKESISRQEIRVNVLGVNHFTWLTEATYDGIDILPVYREFTEKYKDGSPFKSDDNWMNNFFESREMVKMDLFRRFGSIAAAGDRHLAEFCDGGDYLDHPETVKKWKFSLTPVSWREKDLLSRLEKGKRLASGEIPFERRPSEEEGVAQIRALLGMGDLFTNVNLPNQGQIPNLPLGAVVETNAHFKKDSLTPANAGEIPAPIFPLISRAAENQLNTLEGAIKRDLATAFWAFSQDPLVRCQEKEELFYKMVENTKEYLKEY